jgi:putative ABC transport system ATP-binding protein
MEQMMPSGEMQERMQEAAKKLEPMMQQVSEFIVRTRDVHKIYLMGKVEVHALRGVTVDIKRGEYISIMGPSGSGKSTLFNMIGGLDKPTSGSVYINEVDLAQLDAYELAWLRCRTIGYIFPDLQPHPSYDSTGECNSAHDFRGCPRRREKRPRDGVA